MHKYIIILLLACLSHGSIAITGGDMPKAVPEETESAEESSDEGCSCCKG